MNWGLSDWNSNKILSEVNNLCIEIWKLATIDIELILSSKLHFERNLFQRLYANHTLETSSSLKLPADYCSCVFAIEFGWKSNKQRSNAAESSRRNYDIDRNLCQQFCVVPFLKLHPAKNHRQSSRIAAANRLASPKQKLNCFGNGLMGHCYDEESHQCCYVVSS